MRAPAGKNIICRNINILFGSSRTKKRIGGTEVAVVAFVRVFA